MLFVLATLLQCAPLSVEDSQLSTVPLFPERLSCPAFVPEHTETSAATVPPTETAFTVMMAREEFALAQGGF